MTAPSRVPLLDQLTEARAAATPGPWTQDGTMVLGSDEIEIVDCWETTADAACIVVEHNAMPRLVAAVRAVGEVAKEAATVPSWSSVPTDAQEADWRKGYAAAMADFADRVTHVLASVLTEEGTDHD